MNAGSLILCMGGLLGLLPGAAAQELKNYFNDPFLQVTSAMSACPVPEGPLITPEQ
jgi:hypothetical protein